MSNWQPTRGNNRDRHGRGIRQPLLSNLFRAGRRTNGFEQIVNGTCEYLKNAWPDELADLKWQVVDTPSINSESQGVRRWAVRPETMTIVIYRIPIERLGHHRRTDALHERMHIEEFVFAAVGQLVGKDPWDLVPERYRD
ncbi:MAG: hypothetical protein RL100_149 [Actinomycetota bacterium]|jgi:hypothetical protein